MVQEFDRLAMENQKVVERRKSVLETHASAIFLRDDVQPRRSHRACRERSRTSTQVEITRFTSLFPLKIVSRFSMPVGVSDMAYLV